MLIRQYKFPHEYDADLDLHTSADSDRCCQWDWNHAIGCFRKYTGTGPLGLSHWLTKASDRKVIAFFKELLKARTDVRWTGYRVLGTVNRSNGFAVYTLELFAKHPKSLTQVETINPLR